MVADFGNFPEVGLLSFCFSKIDRTLRKFCHFFKGSISACDLNLSKRWNIRKELHGWDTSRTSCRKNMYKGLRNFRNF